MFPCFAYHVVLTPGPSQQTVDLHWHEETELVLVTKGSVDITVGTLQLCVNRGQGLLINPEEIHAMTPTLCGESECYAVVFRMDMLSSFGYDRIQHRFILPLLDGRSQIPRFIPGEEAWELIVLHHLATIVNLFTTQEPGYEMAVKAHLYLILQILAANNKLTAAEESYRPQELEMLKVVLRHIEDHLSERIKLADLSNLVNMSDAHFCRSFKKMTNKTPIEYVNYVRVNRAADYLKSTDKKVAEIALEVGFENLSYFIKVFRMFKRCSPSSFRRTSSRVELQV